MCCRGSFDDNSSRRRPAALESPRRDVGIDQAQGAVDPVDAIPCLFGRCLHFREDPGGFRIVTEVQ